MLVSIFALVLLAEPESLTATQAVIDRGEVRIGSLLVDTFVLVNRGQEPVVITDVKSSCGCLAPKLELRTLNPGERTTVVVEVNTLSQPPGPVGWPVRVSYRCGNAEKVAELSLRARLVSEIRVEPAAIAFQIRKSRSSMITLTDPRPKPLRVVGAGASCPWLRAEVLPGEQLGTTQVRVTAHPDSAPGTRSEVVWLNTDDPNYPQIKVPVTLTVLTRQRVSASPAMATLSRGGTVVVQLRDREQADIAIAKIETEGAVVAESSPGTNGTSTLRIRIDAAKHDGTSQSGTVKVYLTSPIVEVVTVHVDVR